MEAQLDVSEVFKYMRDQIGEQAQQIAILKATIAQQTQPTTNK